MANLLIPAAVVPTVRIPALALTTGGSEVVWHKRTWGHLRWSRRHVIRLPYDPAAAGRLRKHDWLNRIYLLFLPVCLLRGVWWLLQDGGLSSWTGPAAGLLLILAGTLDGRWNASPRPSRTGNGDLYLADLPEAVAERWVAANPQVKMVAAEPAYRLFAPRVYVLGAVVCALTAVLAIRTLFDGEEHSLFLLAGTPALIIAAFVLAYRAVPTGNVRDEL